MIWQCKFGDWNGQVLWTTIQPPNISVSKEGNQDHSPSYPMFWIEASNIKHPHCYHQQCGHILKLRNITCRETETIIDSKDLLSPNTSTQIVTFFLVCLIFSVSIYMYKHSKKWIILGRYQFPSIIICCCYFLYSITD